VTTSGRFIGPARAWYGGGGFWVSEVTANRVSRFAPYTATPGPVTSTPVPPTSTPVPPSNTPPVATGTASAATDTPIAATGTPVLPTSTPGAAATATACTIQFVDVDQNNAFYSFIRCLACRNIVSGYSDNTFRWGSNVTRGQLSKIIANAAGLADPVPPTQQTFEDVAPSNAFWLFIERLAAAGAISGYGCGGAGEPCQPPGNRPYFRWGANATRGQMSKIGAQTFYPNCQTPGQ
jgi:hypothetical protein